MTRYGIVAIVLHWTIAGLILVMIPLGWWMTNALAEKSAPLATIFQAFQLHKSIGLTILSLSLARVAWRLTHPAPALPDTMPIWERRAAHFSHALLYALILILPLTGWAMVSASVLGLPTIWFGLFQWPHLPFLAELADKKPVEDAFKSIHGTLAFIAAGLVALHVAAALKHHFHDRDGILMRILPR